MKGYGFRKFFALLVCYGAVLLIAPAAVLAQSAAPAPKIDTGDTTWILVSTALVMLMTPGLALFYGGMVRRKNVLGTIMHSFIAIALVIFAKWNPLLVIPAAVLFGAAEALQLQLQAAGIDVSPFLLNMAPYLLTLVILALWGWRRQTAAPAALGRSFLGVE